MTQLNYLSSALSLHWIFMFVRCFWSSLIILYWMSKFFIFPFIRWFFNFIEWKNYLIYFFYSRLLLLDDAVLLKQKYKKVQEQGEDEGALEKLYFFFDFSSHSSLHLSVTKLESHLLNSLISIPSHVTYSSAAPLDETSTPFVSVEKEIIIF